MRTVTRVALAFAMCMAIGVGQVGAQQMVTASGKVLDPDGLALPGATITMVEQNTGTSRTVVSEGTGGFSIPNLTPGVYVLTVEMDGFAPLTRAAMTLCRGQRFWRCTRRHWRLRHGGGKGCGRN
jgi:hypothetical protein